MPNFHLIDLESWERREFYLHYVNDVVCTISTTVNVDITPLKGEKLYPTMIWLLTRIVNECQEFRMWVSEDGLGFFDEMNPSYTIFNNDNKNFSCIWTEYSDDYEKFLERYNEDISNYSTSTTFYPKPDMPRNCFDISMIPWMTFTNFYLNVHSHENYLKPIFTMGKFFERDDRRILPLTIQIHHAVCDGYHIAVFVEKIEEAIKNWSYKSK